MRRMTLSALQIRFNVQQRQDPLFTFVDFNQLNWPREGVHICAYYIYMIRLLFKVNVFLSPFIYFL